MSHNFATCNKHNCKDCKAKKQREANKSINRNVSDDCKVSGLTINFYN